ncbi:MAG: hypothetical protein JWQ30_1788 [Sediminibacterium sp.]|nr:hypothetical protein [Sediminibacterium sp.]
MICLEEATAKDCELLYNWANDAEVRSMSIDHRPIVWSDHVKWFEKKLADTNTKIFILKDDQQRVGQIRLENKNDEWVIGYSIAAGCRGKGYGGKIIELALEKISKGVLIAFVKPENSASIKIFATVGFTELGFTEDKGVQLIKFKYEQNK